MRVLALDLGINIGWASGDDQATAPRCGFDRPKGADLGAFCCSYADWLARLLTAEEPAELAVEGGTPVQTIKSPDIAEKMVGVLAVTSMLAYRRRIPMKLTNVMTIRKAVVGTGRADDALIMRAMVELGCTPTSSHAADACAAWFHRVGRRWKSKSSAAA